MSERKNSLRKPHDARSGFVLLAVVVLLMIVSLILTRVAIVSLRKAGEVQANERDLQKRWAVTSLRQYGERSASLLLSPTDDPDSGEPPRVKPAVVAFETLAKIRWEVWIQNESAKLNAVAAAEQRPMNDVLEILGSIVMKGGSGRLRTANEIALFNPEGRREFEYWLEAPTGTSYRQLTEEITLWGDGRLDILAARKETLDAAWRLYFGRSAPDELHAMKDQAKAPTWKDALEVLSLREAELTIANRNFAIGRTVTSVWLIPREAPGVPSYFFVRWGNGAMATQSKGYLY